MNIYDALRMLELNGGHIYRDEADKVAIYWWKSDTWADFEKCRATSEQQAAMRKAKEDKRGNK